VLKSFFKTSAALLLLTAAGVHSQSFPPTVNPRLVATPVPNSAHGYLGMDFLSDGRMVVLSNGNTTITNSDFGGGDVVAARAATAVYIVSGLSATGSLSNVTFTKILDQLTGPPPGVVVVNDTVYVQDRTAFYRINSLNPTGGTSKAQNATRIISVPGNDSTFTWNRGPTGHQWIFTPVYQNGRFYGAYSGSIRRPATSGAPPTSTYSGSILSWSKDSIYPETPVNQGFRKEAGGIRSPNGLGGNGVYMLHTDNQGSFTPGNPIRLFKPGQPLITYGHRQSTAANASGASAADLNPQQSSSAPANAIRNWAEDLPYQPPVIHIPTPTFASTSQPVYLKHGPYKGQWAVGDVNAGGVGRLYVDDVDSTGKYQASFTLFTGANIFTTSESKAVNRMAWSPDSALYIGTLYRIGNWPGGEPSPAMRVTFKDTALLEIMAMRSRKSVSGDTNGVEIVFSEPINPATVSASSFTLSQLNYSLGAPYGCNSNVCQTKTPTVTNVSFSNDNRRVFVAIATPDTSIGAAHIGTLGTGNNPLGMWGGPGKQDRTLKVTINTAVKSATGGSLYYNVAWLGWFYQANKRFNLVADGLNTSVAPSRQDAIDGLRSAVSFHASAGQFEVRVDMQGEFSVSIYGMNGALKEVRSGSAGAFRFDTRSYGRGLHVVRVKQKGGASYSRPLML
jgi:hypothetical protein